ncbi:universal stress protein [Kitasatospora sp. NBC_00070]|uniref:universal stress protein n=1 Tax=Kitasatospora sp. NBC_00070 TaxID=2975962 RepID=UPI00325555EE
MVGVTASVGGLAAVRRAVAEAGRQDAVLVPVVVRSAPDDGRRPPLPESAHAALLLLDTVFERAFGGYPHDLVIHPLVLDSPEPGRALVAAADRPTDLLVLGGSHHGRLDRALHGSVTRYCRTHAACDVVVVSPAELLSGPDRPVAVPAGRP